MPKRINKMTEW